MESKHEHTTRPESRFNSRNFEEASQLFSALGDSERLKILEYLSRGEACVSELAEFFQESISTISHRLKLLQNCRVVSRRRSGKHIYYSLQDEHIKILIGNALGHILEKG